MWWLIALLVLAIGGLCISLYYVYKFGIIILNVQDTIEQSLDVLDERYASITDVMNIPLFYDSPEIRRVLNDIDLTRDSILQIATALTQVEEVDDAVTMVSEEDEV
tara:strand:- start:516 stop:833 length:318 start_codon:yes stop_codon:yes gene_type:complete